MKIIKYFFEAIIIYIFFVIIKLIGLNNGRRLFSYIFIKIGPLVKSKKVVEENIYRVFENNIDNKKVIAEMWSNYGKVFVEYIFLKKFKNNSSKSKFVNIKNLKILDEIIKSKKPVIFISGHFANFELMSMELVKKQINLATIYRPLNNIFLNPLMEYLRKKFICKNQIKKGISGTRECINYLNNNYSVALMVDQRVSEGKRLPFFKHGALTTTLPAQLALKYKFDIVPIYISRNNDDSFEMEFYDPIKTSEKESSEKNKIDISLKINEIIQQMILRNPGQWIWTHNRWK
tara:strand:+ start:4870 stop:5739 length:870 start_codon:yes stop_codon:yes gene_type:complete